jgi:hypothetical protein
MSPYFEELPIGQFFSPKLHDRVWNPETEWVKYYNFTACSVDNNILFEDEFYHWLYTRHKYKAGVLRMENKTMYNWHCDTKRGVCINSMIATPNTSYTFFREYSDVSHSLVELQYYPGSRFIFNNQKEHMVINYDGLRLMLTIEFEEDKNKLSYINLLNEILEDYING